MDEPAESARPKAPVRANGNAAAPWTRWADWTVAVAAGVLLLISLGGWLYHRTQLADLAADQLRLQVTGPAKLRAGIDHEYRVTTSSVTGKPVSAQVEVALYSPQGEQLMGHKEKTDADGRLKVTVPADLKLEDGTKLHLRASCDGMQQDVVGRLSISPVRYLTYLTLDKPLYRPGETIRCRWLTLSSFDLSAPPQMAVQLEMLDPDGAPVAGSQRSGTTRQGVGRGECEISEGLADGRYMLVARSPQNLFPEQRRAFFIRRPGPSGLKTKLELARESYAPGDTVVADISAERADGEPVVGAGLEIVATVDGQVVHESAAKTVPPGTFKIEFALPEKIERGEGQLAVTLDADDGRQTVTRRIPIQLGKVRVRFYPEGGHLVAGLENRVYFTARDPLGEPVDIRGYVVNRRDERVAAVATTHDGRGAFSLEPSRGDVYRLELEGPGDKQEPLRLPAVSTDHKVVLNTGLGVFREGEPLAFNVRASEAGLPLVASAWCRGVPIGQTVLVSKTGANSVTMPLSGDVGGVVRLTIYDYSTSPPEPVAERLVYRRWDPPVQLDISKPAGQDQPGDRANLPSEANGQSQRPAGDTSDNHSPSMAAYFLLATEVKSPQDLQDADFYLSGSREAAVALDLLFGTQGWRRFLEKRLAELRQAGGQDDLLLRLAALGAESAPPAMFDNLGSLQQQHREGLAALRSARVAVSSTLTTLSFLGGAGLVMLVAMLTLLNVARGPRLWVPAIVVATICLIVGGKLMDPRRLESSAEDTTAFMSFGMAEAPPQPAGETPAAETPDRSTEVRPGRNGSGQATEQPPDNQADLPAGTDPQGP